jgi:hypothetical protein
MSEAPKLAPLPSLSPPRLLVEWSSPWQEFVTAIAPALAKSPKQLAGEAPTGLFPYRGILAGWLLEVALLAAATVLPGKIAIVRSPTFTPIPRPNEDVIYWGEELPRTEDLGGAHTGQSGRAGGREGYHRTQTIRVARGESPTEKVVDVPKLNIPKSDLPVANLLAINRTPGPPPTSGLHTSLPALPQPAIVPPSPDVQPDKMRALPASSTSIVAPPPEVQQLATRAVPVSNGSVIAPPPQVARGSSRSLPAENGTVVAPPPEVKRDQVQTAATGIGPEVVPPSPFMPRRAGGVRVPQMGTEIVPPPVSAPVSTTSRSSALSLPQPGIVAPPPSRISREGVSNGGGGQLATIQPRIVAPPVDIQGGGGTGVRGNSQARAANVVPPAPTVSGGGSGMRGGRGVSLIGSGGANAIAAAAPPAGGGGTSNQAGVVISSQPGARMAVPGTGSSGSMAMSPAGTAKSGLGGSGGGNGIGRGNGPGSGLDGGGSGSSKTGAGRGSEVMAKGGTSPFPGAGGAGKNPSGTAPAPGIAVVGGNTITLPSFGSGGGGPNVVDPSRVGSAKSGPGITVVATSRSGGAFNFYGALKGDKVYTIYIDTRFGPAVLQYADPSSAGHAYAEELTAPQPMRADLPTGLTRSRIVIACILDKSGMLKNVRVLEPASSQASGKLLAALAAWKFRPAQRGAEAVEVNAILGFNIDTR